VVAVGAARKKGRRGAPGGNLARPGSIHAAHEVKAEKKGDVLTKEGRRRHTPWFLAAIVPAVLFPDGRGRGPGDMKKFADGVENGLF